MTQELKLESNVGKNPYRLPVINEKSVIARVAKGGCYCVRQQIMGDLKELKATKKKKAELWDLVNENNWESC